MHSTNKLMVLLHDGRQAINVEQLARKAFTLRASYFLEGNIEGREIIIRVISVDLIRVIRVDHSKL